MPYNFPIAVFLFGLVSLGGCASIANEQKTRALESALATYGDAMRWSYFDTAYGFVHPEKRDGEPGDLANVRVTGYDVVQPPVMKDEVSAEQMARIEYVLKDVQRVRTLSDRQLWRYDESAKSWWLDSGVPRFQ